MKNKILAILLSFTLIFTTTGFSFAEDEVVDEQKSEPVQTEKVVEKKTEAPVVKEEVKVKVEAPKAELKEEVAKEEVKEVVKEEAEQPVAHEKEKEQIDKIDIQVSDKPLEQVDQNTKEKKPKPEQTLDFHYMGKKFSETVKQGKSYTIVAAPEAPEGQEFDYWIANGNHYYYVGDKYKYNDLPGSVEFHAHYKDATDELIPIEIHIEGDIVEKVWTGAEQEAFGFTVVSKLPEGTEVSYDIKKAYAAHGTNVGEYDMAYEAAGFKLHGENAGKYKATFVLDKQGKLIITSATYNLVIHDKTKVYGEKDSKFTFDWDGPFKIDPMLYRDEGEKVGDYAIRSGLKNQIVDKPVKVDVEKKLATETKEKISDKVIEVEKPNYYVHVTNGNLRITPREITIAAVYKFKMLKDVTDDEEFDATVTGLLEQDEEWFEEEVYWDVDCDYEEAVGDYPIIVEAEWEPDIYIDDPIFPWPDEFEEWPQEMKKVEDVPMVAAKSVGLKNNSTIVAGNYTIKTVDNVFQIRDKVVPPVDPDNPDNPVVGPTDEDNTPGLGDNDSTVNKASGIVKTGDADACWALLNLFLMITSCLIAFMVVLSRVFKRDEEYVDEPKSFFNNWFESIISGVVAVFTAIIFFITENMNTLMVWTDRWTVMMIVLFVLQLAVVAYVKFKDKIFKEDD